MHSGLIGNVTLETGGAIIEPHSESQQPRVRWFQPLDPSAGMIMILDHFIRTTW